MTPVAGLPPPRWDGIDLYVTWDNLKWAIGGVLSAGGGVAAWVWHLGGRVAALERDKTTMREAFRGLIKKVTEDDKEVNRRLDQALELINELKAETASRQFIEAQINYLSQRIDRVLYVRPRDQG